MSFNDLPKDTVKGKALSELLSPTVIAVAGAAASTNIPVAGITTRDHIVNVLMFASGVPSVLTDVTITSDGNIQSASVTTTNTLIVTYLKA